MSVVSTASSSPSAPPSPPLYLSSHPLPPQFRRLLPSFSLSFSFRHFALCFSLLSNYATCFPEKKILIGRFSYTSVYQVTQFRTRIWHSPFLISNDLFFVASLKQYFCGRSSLGSMIFTRARVHKDYAVAMVHMYSENVYMYMFLRVNTYIYRVFFPPSTK